MARSALLLAIGLMAEGCVAPPMRVVEFRCGQPASVVKAPRSQTYTLYAEPHQRMESTTLASGESIGFIRVGTALQAVAGNDRTPLADGNYIWLLEFGPEPPSAGDVAAEAVIGTALGAGLVAFRALPEILRSLPAPVAR